MRLTEHFKPKETEQFDALFSDRICYNGHAGLFNTSSLRRIDLQFVILGNTEDKYRVYKYLDSKGTAENAQKLFLIDNDLSKEEAIAMAEKEVNREFHSWSTQGRNVMLEHGHHPHISGFEWSHLSHTSDKTPSTHYDTFEEYIKNRPQDVSVN